MVKPEAGLDTKLIFANQFLKRDEKHARIEDFAAAHYQFGVNSLQPVAEAMCPEVKKVINWLNSKGLHARMTGSGSAVFAPIGQVQNLTGAPSDWEIRICKNLAEHPLKDWVSDEKLKG